MNEEQIIRDAVKLFTENYDEPRYADRASIHVVDERETQDDDVDDTWNDELGGSSRVLNQNTVVRIHPRIDVVKVYTPGHPVISHIKQKQYLTNGGGAFEICIIENK